MTIEAPIVNTIAPIQNVSRCMATLQRVIDRPGHLPGIIAFYGWSGLGKTTAAAYISNEFRAYRVEVKSFWSQRGLFENILVEMRIKPAKTIMDMGNQIAEQLSITNTPLIIDEFDFIVQKKWVNLIRDLYDASAAPILIMGEEHLETNLRKPEWERFHNRVIDWVPAVKTDLDDARHLARLYCPDITIADDLLHEMINTVDGNASRICINLASAQEHALKKSKSSVDLADWKASGLQFYTGSAPRRRVK